MILKYAHTKFCQRSWIIDHVCRSCHCYIYLYLCATQSHKDCKKSKQETRVNTELALCFSLRNEISGYFTSSILQTPTDTSASSIVEGEQLDISLLTLSIFLSGIQPRSQPKPARRDLLGTMRPRLMPRPRGGGRHEHGPPLASGPGGD